MRRRPLLIGFIRPNLQMNQMLLTVIMTRHCRKRLPIDTFFINTQSAPFWFVLKNLMNQLIDAGTGFAGPGIPSNEPATAKLVAFPGQAAELCDMVFALSWSRQEPVCNKCQQNSISKQDCPQRFGKR